MKLLYIHGYNGDPCGESFKNLKTACADNHELFTIDYTPDCPKNAIAEIASFVRENKIDVVIGASLGGFLAMNLYGVSRIVVNPCWNPAKEIIENILPLHEEATSLYVKQLKEMDNAPWL